MAAGRTIQQYRWLYADPGGIFQQSKDGITLPGERLGDYPWD